MERLCAITNGDSFAARTPRHSPAPWTARRPEFGHSTPLAAAHTSKVASAQIKSAILLAGINARGTSTITEPHASRDHTESMLRHFGASVTQTTAGDGTYQVALQGEAILRAADIAVPRDPSSAAFPMVAALLTPRSDITLPGVGMNPLRNGLITTLQEMGGEITLSHARVEGYPLAVTLAWAWHGASRRVGRPHGGGPTGNVNSSEE